MQNDKIRKLERYFGWAVKRLALLLYDICVVNAAYYLALVIRFYVNGEFRQVALDRYLPAFAKFAPYYTVICVIVFIFFQLYYNRWKHAGLHDLNRIFAANAVTAVAQIAGTLLFVDRMPITYYFIGATVQFFMITVSRFSYRLFVLEMARIRSSRHATMNVMIVGVGDTARTLRRQIENDRYNVARPVCIFSYKPWNSGRMMNGLPVVTDMDRLQEHLAKYKVKCVILADAIMPMEIRKKIREICQASNVEVQDFSGYLQQDGPGLTPKALLEHIGGPVDVMKDGKTVSYDDSEKALLELGGNYSVQSVSARDGRIVIELTNATVILNDVDKDWVKATEEETGKEISFF